MSLVQAMLDFGEAAHSALSFATVAFASASLAIRGMQHRLQFVFHLYCCFVALSSFYPVAKPRISGRKILIVALTIHE